MFGGVYPGQALFGGTPIFSGTSSGDLGSLLASSRSSATASVTGGVLKPAPVMTYPTTSTVIGYSTTLVLIEKDTTLAVIAPSTTLTILA